MKNNLINTKEQRNRQEQQSSYYDASQTVLDLHGLLSRPGRPGLTIGEMVNVANSMGLLSGGGKRLLEL